MTANAIAANELIERRRSNRAQETETNRHNVSVENETVRSNLVKEAETNRHNAVVEDTARFEAETNRSKATHQNIQGYINAGANVVGAIGKVLNPVSGFVDAISASRQTAEQLKFF